MQYTSKERCEHLSYFFVFGDVMKTIVPIVALIVVSAFATYSQPADAGSKSAKAAAPAPASRAPMDIAKATLAAHGGEKLKQMKTLVQKGTVDLTVTGQTLPAAFSSVMSGQKYSFEVVSPMQQLKQVYDGNATYSSLQGFSLPPMTSLGFPLLPRIGDAGYVISELGEKNKKRLGFRVTTPEGFYTDFYINEKTGQIKGYDSSFETGGGQLVTTSAEIDEFQTVDGIIVPKKYSQRFNLGTIEAYINFKTKEILVNSPIADSVFTMPK